MLYVLGSYMDGNETDLRLRELKAPIVTGQSKRESFERMLVMNLNDRQD